MEPQEYIRKAWKTAVEFIGPILLLTIVQLGVSILSLGILAPVTLAGYTQSLLLAFREKRTPEIKDIFSYFSLFLPLFLFGLLAAFAIFVGFLLMVLPGIILILAIVFSCAYMLPLMTDQKMKIIDSIKESWNMAKRDPLTDQVVFIAIYVVIIAIGTSIPFGIIITQPLATLILVAVYETRLGFE